MRANTALSSNPSASNIGGTLRPVTAGTNLLVFIMVSQVYYYPLYSFRKAAIVVAVIDITAECESNPENSFR
jgi:hypothetical protein